MDVLGFDIYQKGSVGTNDALIKDLDKSLTTLEALATEHNKILALTGFGYNEVPDSTWWTNVLWKGMQNHKISCALAGAMQVKK